MYSFTDTIKKGCNRGLMVGKNRVVPTIFRGINSLPDCICTISPTVNSGLLMAGNGNCPVGMNIPRGSLLKSDDHENVSPDRSAPVKFGDIFKLSGVSVGCGSSCHCCMSLNCDISVYDSLIVSSPEIRLLMCTEPLGMLDDGDAVRNTDVNNNGGMRLP